MVFRKWKCIQTISGKSKRSKRKLLSLFLFNIFTHSTHPERIP